MTHLYLQQQVLHCLLPVHAACACADELLQKCVYTSCFSHVMIMDIGYLCVDDMDANALCVWRPVGCQRCVCGMASTLCS